MHANEVAAAKTPCDKDAVFASMRVALPDEPTCAILVLMAQQALETGWWHRCYNFNLGGYKSGLERMHTYFATTERLPIGTALRYVGASTPAAPCKILTHDTGFATVLFQPSHPVCRFRAYASLDDGVSDYVSEMRRRFVHAWGAAQAGDAGLFVTRLHEVGYFTAGVDAYSVAVRQIYASLQKEYAGR